MNTESFSTNLWHRFKKNKVAMAGLIFIFILLLISVFAYNIMPDDTPEANRQTLEIQARKPGFSQLFLLLDEKKVNKKSVLSSFFTGNVSTEKWIPITSIQIKNNELNVQRYIDEDTVKTEIYLLKELVKNNEPIENRIVRKKFLLGTDGFGRDVLSRLLLGTRISLGIGMAGMLIALMIGTCLGLMAGYYKGRTDVFISWLMNVNWSLPALMIAFAITITLGKGVFQIFIAIGLSLWVNVARMVRGQVLSVKEQPYVEAARVLGLSNARIIFRHILPNIAGPLWVVCAANFASAIMLEAGLSFLGIGLQPPSSSWGLMIRENFNFIITDNPTIALAPGIAIMLLVLAVNVVGNGLRDALQVNET